MNIRPAFLQDYVYMYTHTHTCVCVCVVWYIYIYIHTYIDAGLGVPCTSVTKARRNTCYTLLHNAVKCQAFFRRAQHA